MFLPVRERAVGEIFGAAGALFNRDDPTAEARNF